MPELPEVETICRDLKEIIGEKVSFNKLIYDTVFKTPFYNMAGQDIIIENIERFGKYIIIRFNKKAMIVHLGMSGKLILDYGDVMIPKHCSWLIQLTNGKQLRYIDFRYFGKVWHLEYDEAVHYVQSRLGPEIWDITAESFLLITRQPKYQNKMIKPLLLDQKYIAGIGNIYASEICYETFINPFTLVKDLRDSQIEQMYYNIKKVLEKAIENNGTSFKDYRNAKNQTGNNQNFLKAYKQTDCLRCEYNAAKSLGPDEVLKFPITKDKIQGRMTYYCGSCQK
jgi:formamidopyrimidine-DNA glycosylase